ncbi:unnamed protein product [Alopecurus aequalis]
MHPAGAAAAEAAGGAFMDARAAARATIILGLAMAAIALVAATINPADFHAQAQIIEYAAPALAPAPGVKQCVATEAEVLDLRGIALALVLMGVLQAVMAAAADVALAGSFPLGHLLSAAAHLFGAINAYYLCYVVNGAAVLALGHCAGEHIAYLVIGYVLVAVSSALLLGVSFAVTFC